MQGQLAPTAQPPPRSAPGQLWQVARALMPHLPGLSDVQRSGLQQLLPNLPSGSPQVDQRVLKAFCGAAKLAQQAMVQQSEAPAAAADPADVRVLAVRRAHALAQRRGCGKPRCASLAGASEAEARGSRCSGCRLLRFCGVACSREEWRWHKLGCRALLEEAAAA